MPPKRPSFDYERLAAELLRALRARRSRPGFSRFLGYRSNVAQRWETEECWPTADRFFEICSRLRLDVRGAIARFLRYEPSWLKKVHVDAGEGVAALLTELGGRMQLTDIAQRSGHNRYSVGRWFKGTASPKLPDFLALVDACSRRLLDWVAAFVDPLSIPSLKRRWQKLLLSRELAHTHPMSHAVLRALELDGYEDESEPSETYLARKLGITTEEVQRALLQLAASGQVRQVRKRWRVRRVEVVDTGPDPQRARALKLGWAKSAIERLERGGPGYSGYSLFSISRRDLARVREVQLAYVREMQAIIAASKPSDCVALYCALLIDLGAPEENAFAL